MRSKQPVRPPGLTAGSRVRLVAPAGPLLERDEVTRGVELCRALGYAPTLGAHAGDRFGYFAGRDEDRLDDLNAALRDPEVDAVWCLRGGYGVTRILDRVDFAALMERPRPVLGYSDITALLLAVLSQAGQVAFHAPTARSELSGFSRKHLQRVLTARSPAGRLEPVAPPVGALVPSIGRIVTISGGVSEGPLLGGNLTLIQCLIGTRFLPSFEGALLFLEDVGEDLYRVDRTLSHLRLAGVLDRLAGVIVGQFTGLRRASDSGARGFDEVLADYFVPLGIPTASGFPIGHVEDQWTIPLGVRARLDAGAGTVELLETAVS